MKAHGTSDALFGQVDLAASLAKLVESPIDAGDCGDSRDELDTLLGEDAVGRPHLVHEAGGHALRVGSLEVHSAGEDARQFEPGATETGVAAG